MSNSFSKFKEALYVVAESIGTSILLFTMAFVMLYKQKLILVIFGIFLVIMALLYTVLKCCDAWKILEEMDGKRNIIYSFVLFFFTIGYVAMTLVISLMAYSDFIEKMVANFPG